VCNAKRNAHRHANHLVDRYRHADCTAAVHGNTVGHAHRIQDSHGDDCSHSHADDNRNGDAHGNGDCTPRVHRDINSHTFRYANRKSDIYTDTDIDAAADVHGHANTIVDAVRDANLDGNQCQPRAHRRGRRSRHRRGHAHPGQPTVK
ncbi:MAG: hypothetical protein KDD84_01265, partial [Caldilineaceae bacterium]|nr:hypothetical protein [Caldilineaceae bacterium]